MGIGGVMTSTRPYLDKALVFTEMSLDLLVERIEPFFYLLTRVHIYYFPELLLTIRQLVTDFTLLDTSRDELLDAFEEHVQFVERPPEVLSCVSRQCVVVPLFHVFLLPL